jgi:hypothetical protein
MTVATITKTDPEVEPLIGLTFNEKIGETDERVR